MKTFLLGIVVFGSVGHGPADPAPEGKKADQLFALTNRERSAHRLAALRLDPDLSRAAAWLASDMANKAYVDHLDSKGRRAGDRAYDFGYRAWTHIGENIAAGVRTPHQVLAAWMDSPVHRAMIVSRDFADIGIGCAEVPGSPHEMYYVQLFGTRPAYAAKWRRAEQ